MIQWPFNGKQDPNKELLEWLDAEIDLANTLGDNSSIVVLKNIKTYVANPELRAKRTILLKNRGKVPYYD